jgi:hypothetical protein
MLLNQHRTSQQKLLKISEAQLFWNNFCICGYISFWVIYCEKMVTSHPRLLKHERATNCQPGHSIKAKLCLQYCEKVLEDHQVHILQGIMKQIK